MENLYNIHEVLEMMMFSNKEYTIPLLIEEIKNTFGEDASFINCAEQVLSSSEVPQFLIDKNKVVVEGETLRMKGKPCEI